MAGRKVKKMAVAVAVALLAMMIVAVIVIGFFAAVSWARLQANAARAKTGVPTDPQAVAQAAGKSKILVFRNIRSFKREQDFEEALTNLQFKFDVKPSVEMANTDLALYDVVIIPGGQWDTGFYGDYDRSAARFDSYVSNGGTLLLELNGAEYKAIQLPDGVRMVRHYARANQLLLPEHPILLPLGGRPIRAYYASHGYLANLPKNAVILASETTWGKPDPDRPTFVEYSLGSGRVIAACQCFHDQDGSGRGPLMRSVIGYAAVKQWFTPGNKP